jgi:hypothetical protein
MLTSYVMPPRLTAEPAGADAGRAGPAVTAPM